MKRSKLLSLLLVGALSASLVACGSASGSTSGDTANSASTETTESASTETTDSASSETTDSTGGENSKKPLVWFNRQPSNSSTGELDMTALNFNENTYYVGFDANQGAELQGQMVLDYIKANAATIDVYKRQVGYLMKGVSDRKHSELAPADIYRIFEDSYVDQREIFDVPECHFRQTPDGITAEVTIEQNKERRVIETSGNGRLDAVSNAIKLYFGISYELSVYEENAISRGSSSKAAAYVGIMKDGKMYWGVGIDEDIIKSSIAALVSAGNKLTQSENIREGREERIVDIMNYLKNHYKDVTLDELADNFNLSKPYLSKYIKENAGITFQEAVKQARMKKARAMLKESNKTVESIAASVGYENVEHFNRLFKKSYGMTPVQFRRESR